MKATTLVLGAFGLTGLTAGQNGNDPLILNNRTALHVSVPHTPSSVRSNTFIRPTTSIECWRNGYPCGQNGGQQSQRLVADFIVPTPALNARVPPSEFFSTRTDIQVPGVTEVPHEMPLDTLAPVPEPTGEGSMDILPIPTSLGGEPPKHHAPPTGEAIVLVLPITSSMPAQDNSPVTTSLPYDPYSTWPSRWRGATSEVVAAPSETPDCNLHFCPTGTVNSTSTLPPTPQPTIPGPAEPSTTMPVVFTSSHFAIPPDPSSPIVQTSTSSLSAPEMSSLPINTAPGIIQAPLLTSAPSTSSLPSMSIPEGIQERLVYCGTDKCVTVKMADLTSCHGTPTPRSGLLATSEFTAPVSAATTATREPITVMIDCKRHHCLGIETVYTITPTPTPYTYPIVPATSGFAIPPEVTPVGEPRAVFVPIEFWRGPNEPVVRNASKTLGGVHGPIQRRSSFAPKPSVATDSPCYRHYCPSGFTPKPAPTTMMTTSKPVPPVESASLYFPTAPPSFETFAA
ncbi:hypothetical protein SLS61_003864 [Didymella pomorum]